MFSPNVTARPALLLLCFACLGAVRDVRDFGAVGDGKADDTEAVRKAAAAVLAGDTLRFPAGTYRVSLGSADINTVLCGFKGLDGVRVVFEGDAKVATEDVFPAGTVGWCCFRFSACDDCEIVGGGFRGVSEWETKLPNGLRATYRKGAVFCRLDSGSDGFRMSADLSGLAYGVYAGAGLEYMNLAGGERYDLTVRGTDIGYPVAMWGAGHGGRIDVTASRVHRALYLAGVREVRARVGFRDADAPVACLVTGNPVRATDPKDADAEVGCRDVEIDAADLGSTHQPPTGQFCVGAGVSTDHGHGAHEGIRLRFRRVLGPDSPPNLGGFQTFSGGPSLAGNDRFEFRGITIGGLLDRSTQPSRNAYRVGVIGDAVGKPGATLYGLTIADLEVRENPRDPAPLGIDVRTNAFGSPVTWEHVRGMSAPLVLAGGAKHAHVFRGPSALNVVTAGPVAIEADEGSKLSVTAEAERP